MNLEITKQIQDSALQLDSIANECSALGLAGDAGFLDALKTAQAIKRMRELLTPEIMQPIMELMNTPLGFRTDRDPTKRDKNGNPIKPYSVDQVRECLIESSFRGVPPICNCWNIISERSYITKEGFQYLLKNRVSGFSDLKKEFSIPTMKEGGAIIKCKASWKYNGKSDSIERDIAVRLNAGMGVDAALGKAERKLLATIYSQVTGTEITDGEVDDELVNVTPQKDDATESPLRRKPKAEPIPAETVEEPEKPDKLSELMTQAQVTEAELVEALKINGEEITTLSELDNDQRDAYAKAFGGLMRTVLQKVRK